MPYRRPDARAYYIKRTVPGLGKLTRSLRTNRKSEALRRETLLLKLAERGRLDLVRGVLDGRVRFAELTDAVETDGLGDLTNRLNSVNVTVAEAVTATIENKRPDVRASTLNRYETGLEHFKAFVGERANVAETLTTERVQAFKAQRVAAKAARETINNDLIGISILTTYAMSQGWIDKRPNVKRFKRKDRICWLEANEVNVYMAALRRPFRPLIELLVFTGMRLGEAESLRVCDLRFGSKETRALIEDAKTETGVRPVFVPTWTANSVRDHIEEHGLAGRDRLFAIPRRTVQKEHGRACTIAGIHEYTLHDHRHTFAVAAARACMPLNLVQQQLGHARIDMTMRYARFHPAYSDVSPYFEVMGQSWGTVRGTAEEQAEQAAAE